MYHAYQAGYSVLPRLKKLGLASPFQITLPDVDRYLAAKRVSVRKQPCFLEHNISPEIYQCVCDFLIRRYPWKFRPPHSFPNLALQIQEDLVIHRSDDQKDWMAACHICFPSGWCPEEKIGRSLAEIHAPIPGMNFRNQRELVEAMIHAGLFERYVWSVAFDDRLNWHPRLPKPRFDPQNPRLFVKVERQVTIGFPEHRAALFVLRQFFIPEDRVRKPVLRKSLQAMSPAELEYKGLTECIEELLAYLAR